MKRRTLIASSIASVPFLKHLSAAAQTYPSRTIRWVMPFPAGGPTDAIARKLAEIVGTKIGQPIIVDNRPGASGSIGTGEVARSAPDGYTFAIAIPDSLISVASLIKSVSYDARTDLTLVMKICHAIPVLVVGKQLGVSNFKQLLEAAKKTPGKIAYGTWGVGTLPQLVMKSIERESGTRFMDVPYKGLAPVIQDILGGTVHLALVPPSVVVQYKDLVPLVTTGGERSSMLPDVPTVQEEGVDAPILRSTMWTGLVAPKGLPQSVLEFWTDVLTRSIKEPAYTEFLASVGQTPLATASADFGRQLTTEFVTTNDLIRSLGITVQ